VSGGPFFFSGPDQTQENKHNNTPDRGTAVQVRAPVSLSGLTPGRVVFRAEVPVPGPDRLPPGLLDRARKLLPAYPPGGYGFVFMPYRGEHSGGPGGSGGGSTWGPGGSVKSRRASTAAIEPGLVNRIVKKTLSARSMDSTPGAPPTTPGPTPGPASTPSSSSGPSFFPPHSAHSAPHPALSPALEQAVLIDGPERERALRQESDWLRRHLTELERTQPAGLRNFRQCASATDEEVQRGSGSDGSYHSVLDGNGIGNGMYREYYLTSEEEAKVVQQLDEQCTTSTTTSTTTVVNSVTSSSKINVKETTNTTNTINTNTTVH